MTRFAIAAVAAGLPLHVRDHIARRIHLINTPKAGPCRMLKEARAIANRYRHETAAA